MPTYLNGRLPAALLGKLEGVNRYVRVDVVDQTNAMREDFQRDLGIPLVVTDAYRDYPSQVIVKASKGWLAATPGTSNHGWGMALDLGSGVNSFGTDAHDWMREYGARYGYRHPSWAQRRGYKPEPWHWECGGPVPREQYRPAGSAPAGLDKTILEAIMAGPARIRTAKGGIYFVDVTAGNFRALTPETNRDVERLDIPITVDNLSQYERDRIRALVLDLSTPRVDG